MALLDDPNTTSLKLFEEVEKFWQFLGAMVASVPLYMHMKVTLPKDAKDDALIGLDKKKKYFEPNSPNFLPSHFTKLRSLLMFQYSAAYQLLPHWPNLTELYLFGIPSDAAKLLWPALDSMKSLKVLYLIFLSKNTEIIPNDVSALGQLEEFSLGHYYSNLSKVLGQLGFGIRKLSLWYSQNFPAAEIQSAFVYCPVVTCNVTHLKVTASSTIGCYDLGQDYYRILNVVAHTFVKLTCLEMPFYDLSFADVVPLLAQITTLNELVFDHTISDPMKWPNVNTVEQKLESVTTLHINDTCLKLSEERFCRYIPAIFPNVQVLNYNGVYCVFKAQLKQMKKLRTFHHNSDHYNMNSVAGKYSKGLDKFMQYMSMNMDTMV